MMSRVSLLFYCIVRAAQAGEASARARGDEARGDTTDEESDSDEPRVSSDVPCCSRWASRCAAARRCVHGARVVRRIHDEDGAAVDVVYSQQRVSHLEPRAAAATDVPLPQPRAVAYKTYDTRRNESLEYLVQTEARAGATCSPSAAGLHFRLRLRCADARARRNSWRCTPRCAAGRTPFRC